jgi:putative transposase
VVNFIHAHKDRWRVEPICKALQVAPSTYYAAVARPLSARRQRDEQLKIEIGRGHRDNFGVYRIEKVWRQLNREGTKVGRDRIARLMDEMNLEGIVRGKRKPITTMAAEMNTRPEDLVERDFSAAAPNALWVAGPAAAAGLLRRVGVPDRGATWLVLTSRCGPLRSGPLNGIELNGALCAAS